MCLSERECIWSSTRTVKKVLISQRDLVVGIRSEPREISNCHRISRFFFSRSKNQSYFDWLLTDIGMIVRVFTNGQGDLGSIPGRVIPKTQKWYLMSPCLTLSIIRYGSRVKWSNLENGVLPSPKPWCSSYRKGSPQVTLDYGRQLYFLLTDKFWK